MDGLIRYINTDLELTSSEALTDLAGFFVAGNLFCLHVTQDADGQWDASFEAQEGFTEPEQAIAAMLSVAESLPGPLRSVWDSCTLREFNIGYDCGAEPWAFNQGLSVTLLGRIAALSASLRFTLYPEREQVAPPAAI